MTGGFDYLPTRLSDRLRRQLWRIRVAGAVVIVAVAALFALYVYSDARQTRQAAREQVTTLADMLAQNVEGSLDAARNLLAGMRGLMDASANASRPHDPAIRGVLLGWMKDNPYLMDLLVVDGSGQIIHWTGPGTPPDVTDRNYVRVHVHGVQQGMFVGGPQMSKVHKGRWFFALSEAVRDGGGKLRYIVVAIVDVAHLGDRLGRLSSPPGGSLALTTEQGDVYSRYPGHEEHVGKQLPEIIATFTSGSKEPRFVDGVSPLDGVRRAVAARPLRAYPLVAFATLADESIVNQWRARALWLSSLMLMVIGASLWMIRLMSRDAREQERLATVDGLTGVLNRRAVMQSAAGFERRAGYVGSLTVLMIDVDHFKSVNDRFGHAVGDAVLQEVGALLTRQIRNSDIVGRFGGEEFIALLPGTNLDGGRKVAEKMRQEIEATEISGTRVTISIGVASLGYRNDSIERLLRQADEALYAAKAGGRNRVVLAKAAEITALPDLPPP